MPESKKKLGNTIIIKILLNQFILYWVPEDIFLKSTCKPGVQVFSPSTQEAEPINLREFQASQGDIVRPGLRKQNNKKKKLTSKEAMTYSY